MDLPTRVVFLGCPPGEEVANALSQWQTHLHEDLAAGPAQSAVRWILRPALHLTLHYLGPLGLPQIRSVQSDLGEVLEHFRAVPFALGKPGVFPQASRPRGIWIEIRDLQDQLRPLHAELYGVLQNLGLESRSARFHPHFTIGRLPRSVNRNQRQTIVRTVQAASSRQTGISCQGELDRVHLYESLPQPGGNAYCPLSTWPLIRNKA